MNMSVTKSLRSGDEAMISILLVEKKAAKKSQYHSVEQSPIQVFRTARCKWKVRLPIVSYERERSLRDCKTVSFRKRVLVEPCRSQVEDGNWVKSGEEFRDNQYVNVCLCRILCKVRCS